MIQNCSNCGGKDEPLQASCRTCTTFLGKWTNWYPKKQPTKNVGKKVGAQDGENLHKRKNEK